GAESIAAAEAALALGPTGEPDGRRHAWYALAIGAGMLEGPPAGLHRLADHLPPDPDDVTGDAAQLLVAPGMLAQLAGRIGEPTPDLRSFTDPGRRAPTNQLVRALLSLSRALFAAGEWDEALAQARTGLSLVLDEGRVWTAGQAEATLALVLAARGDWN